MSGVEAAAHLLGRGGGGRTTTTFTLERRFSPDRVAAAVRRWVQYAPVLSLRVEETSGGPRFRRSGPAVAGGPDPAPVAASSGGGRLWGLRAAPAPGGTVFRLTLHPAICDSYSAARLLRSLLAALADDEPSVDGRRSALAYPCPLPPDTDGLTYAGGGACVCGGCGRRRPPSTAERHGSLGRGGSVARRAAVVRAPRVERVGGMVVLALPARESHRLREWCADQRLTVGAVLTSALATALGRHQGRSEVAVTSALSLRRRYAEHTLIAEPGCVAGSVAARLAVDPRGGSPERTREDAAVLCAAGRRWRPPTAGRGADRGAREAAGGGAALRVVEAGALDSALGAHAAQVTALRTVAAPVRGACGAVLHLSSFRGELLVTLTSEGLRPGWAGTAERVLAEAVRPHRLVGS